MIKIWSDGSCLPNPGPGGWGFVVVYSSGKEFEKFGGQLNVTNNAMELQAAIEALSIFSKPRKIAITTDSMYVVNGITKWVSGWIKKNWKTSTGQPVSNKELWQRLYTLNKYHTVEWNWTKGHANDPYNERADVLANKGRLKALKQPNRHEKPTVTKSPVEISAINTGLFIAIDWHKKQCEERPHKKRFHQKCMKELKALMVSA